MVKKQSRIVRNPKVPPTPDDWVEQGGLDPELNASPPPRTKQKGKATGGAYPHRLSLDLDTSQYKRLKKAAFDSDRPMNEIVREAVEGWLQQQDY